MPRRQPASIIKAQELKRLYNMTTDAFIEQEPSTNTHESLIQRVQSKAREKGYPLNDVHAIKVVDMYLEVKHGAPLIYPSHADEPSDTSHAPPFTRPSENTSIRSSALSTPRIISIVNHHDDHSIRIGNTRHETRNHYNSPTRSHESKKKDKENKSSVEQNVKAVGLVVALAFLTWIASKTIEPLYNEILNHNSRFTHNEGAVQGSLLLMGIATSYCLALLSIYEIAGGLLMGAMMAAGFANPAAWACAAIALSALIAMPLFNMVIREGIYSLFSAFDNQALVDTDNRFRVLTQTEADKLPRKIDVDRINFATLAKHDELELSQVRSRFALFDWNTSEMSAVLKDIRTMRTPTGAEHGVNIKNPDTDQFVKFSFFRAEPLNDTSSHYQPTDPSAPPLVEAVLISDNKF
ncbi:MAG: hypothetical protein P1U36_03350 [Legionellaceae bacterium]|nr:hypothetical protein [Legionellaceae bacterium]